MTGSTNLVGTAVVWGRTAGADQWWRRLPDDPVCRAWTTELVAIAVAEEVDVSGTTCVTARHGATWLVGVHVLASRLSNRFGYIGEREFGVFVGWLVDDPPGIPLCTSVRDRAVSWAAPLWERVAAADWALDASAATYGPVEQVPIPWLDDASARLLEPRVRQRDIAEVTLAGLSTGYASAVRAVPEEEADAVVTARVRAGGDFGLVTGLRQRPRSLPPALTDVALTGVSGPVELLRDSTTSPTHLGDGASGEGADRDRRGGFWRKVGALVRGSSPPVAVLRSSILVTDGQLALVSVDTDTGEVRLPGRLLIAGELPRAVAAAELSALGAPDAPFRLDSERSHVRDGVAHVELIYVAGVGELNRASGDRLTALPLEEAARLLARSGEDVER